MYIARAEQEVQRRSRGAASCLHRGSPHPDLGRVQPLLGPAEADDRLEALAGLGRRPSAEVRNQHSKWSSRTPRVVGRNAVKTGSGAMSEVAQRRDLRCVAEVQPGPGPPAQGDVGRALEVDGRPHHHAAEHAVVRGPDVERQRASRAAGRSRSRAPSWPSTSYWLDTVVGVMVKSRLAWCLGMPQMPLPPFTETSLLTGRSTHELPGAVVAAQQAGQQRRRRLAARRCRRWRGSTRRTCRCR